MTIATEVSGIKALPTLTLNQRFPFPPETSLESEALHDLADFLDTIPVQDPIYKHAGFIAYAVRVTESECAFKLAPYSDLQTREDAIARANAQGMTRYIERFVDADLMLKLRNDREATAEPLNLNAA